MDTPEPMTKSKKEGGGAEAHTKKGQKKKNLFHNRISTNVGGEKKTK